MHPRPGAGGQGSPSRHRVPGATMDRPQACLFSDTMMDRHSGFPSRGARPGAEMAEVPRGRHARNQVALAMVPAVQLDGPSAPNAGQAKAMRASHQAQAVVVLGTGARPLPPMPPVPRACLPGFRGRHRRALSSARVRIGGDGNSPHPLCPPRSTIGAAAYLFQIRDLLAALAPSDPRYLPPSRSTTCFSPPQSPSGR